MTGPNDAVVLLVEADAELRDRLGSWLEEDGREVLSCPGPRAPRYECIGGRGGPCPLVGPADVIVLDVTLPGEAFMEGTAASDLLSYYSQTGKPVIVLGRDTDIAEPFLEDVVVLPWPPAESTLTRAVQALVPD